MRREIRVCDGHRERHAEIAGSGTRHFHPHSSEAQSAEAENFYPHTYHRLALDIVRKTVQDQLTEIIEVCAAPN